jgi:hypothetical protein
MRVTENYFGKTAEREYFHMGRILEFRKKVFVLAFAFCFPYF